MDIGIYGMGRMDFNMARRLVACHLQPLEPGERGKELALGARRAGL